MSTPEQKQRTPIEYKYMPCMYLWVALKKGGTKVFYSRELRNSLKQIAHRGSLPNIDLHFGYQSLQNLAEETLKGQYNKAIIYGLVNNNITSGIKLCEYDKNGKFTPVKEPDFNSEKWQQRRDIIASSLVQICNKYNVIIPVFDPQNPIVLR
jgi:hypothetical protein